MFRGEVWDVQFPPPIGNRPCLILTTNALIPRLGAITVAEITGTPGPPPTHIPVDPDVGLTGREESWINVTGLHTIPKGRLRRLRGRLQPVQMRRVEIAMCDYLGINTLEL